MVLGMTTKAQRQRALKSLPPDLYGSFQGIITRIRGCPKPSQAELGMRVLMWLHFSFRPLELVELQHALAVETGHTELHTDNIPPRKALLDCCLGLVVVDDETLTVRFVHYTLEEYFRKYTREEFPNGYSYIAETCLTYLNFGELRQHCTNLDSLEKKKNTYKFLSYAALYWGTYVKQQCNYGLTNLAKMIVDHESERPPCAIQVLYTELNNIEFLFLYGFVAQRFSGIHATACFGLSENMVYFCSVERHMDLKDESGRTPLLWAAMNGHETVVRLLIERDDVDVNAEDSDGKTPLLWAANNRHEAVVRLLIERDDVDVNAKDNKYGQTLLSWAAENGHEAVVRLLIERDDVDVNAKDNQYGQTPLSWAAKNGHEAVVRLLIERDDVDVNAKDNKCGLIPLLWAAKNGHEAVVRLLIERGVDVNAKDNEYGLTPLSFAAMNGHEAVVRLLIERDDVDVNAKDNKDGQKPLSWAAKNGHEAVVRLLIERDDVDVNAKDNEYGQTPLSFAATNGHEAVVRLLIERGVDVDTKDKCGLTPLSFAAVNGHEAIVRLLIERDVDVDTTDKYGQTPLSWAAQRRHNAIVQLLEVHSPPRIQKHRVRRIKRA